MLGGIAARRDDQDVWLRCDHFIQRDAEGRRARLAENVAAAGEFDHFRHPVSADVNGLQPFEKCDAWALACFAHLPFDSAEFFADGFQQLFRGVRANGLFADPKNVAPDVAKIERIEAQHFRALIEIRQNCGQIFGRSGADVAQILGDDEIGREAAQGFGVDGIDAFAARS